MRNDNLTKDNLAIDNYKELINSNVKTSLLGYNKSQIDEKLKSLNIYCGRVESEYDSLIEEFNLLNDECGKYKHQVSLYETEIENLQKENDSLNDQVFELTNKLSELKSLIGLNVKQETNDKQKNIKCQENNHNVHLQGTSISNSINDNCTDDDLLVGEIEDRKHPERIMIGDGEEDTNEDFVFM